MDVKNCPNCNDLDFLDFGGKGYCLWCGYDEHFPDIKPTFEKKSEGKPWHLEETIEVDEDKITYTERVINNDFNNVPEL